MNTTIIIFGFSGSGKSTLAKSLGQHYALRVIHPSSILRNLCEGKPINLSNTTSNRGFWEHKKGIQLFKSRLNQDQPLDVVSDKILLREVKKGDVVIDSWSLPWLSKSGLKIYLKTDFEVRARRVAKRSKLTLATARRIVFLKDKETCKLFKRVYGFDIKHDHSVFDIILNTNNLSKLQVFKRVCEQLPCNT